MAIFFVLFVQSNKATILMPYTENLFILKNFKSLNFSLETRVSSLDVHRSVVKEN